jgi:hypothetical protein
MVLGCGPLHAQAHAWHWCCNAGLKLFTTPLFASLSDSFGRIPSGAGLTPCISHGAFSVQSE